MRSPWFTFPPWDELPSWVAWLTDHVACAPLLEEAGGTRWRRELRERFLEGSAAAGSAVVLAGSGVALQSALHELTLGQSGRMYEAPSLHIKHR